MTTKIMALVDGSMYAVSVCRHAAWLAVKTGAPVELTHVLGRREAPDKRDLSGTIQLGARTKLLQELAQLDAQRAKLASEHGRAILEDARTIVSREGAEKTTTRLRHGDILETIAEIENETAILVVGKRGEAADFAKGHLGSNLERIVRASRRPVMVASDAYKPIKSVLLAYDGGVSATKALVQMSRSPLLSQLAVTIATVGEESASAQKSLREAQSILQEAGIDATTRRLSGQPEPALSQLVEEEGFGLVVMGAYGHSRIRSLIIGSTTTEMIRSCQVPIILTR